MSLFSLENKTIVIIGGSGGIGGKISIELAKVGANICIVSRSRIKLEKIVDEAKKDGLEIVPFVADATSCQQVKIAKELIIKKYGKINILINSQGINIKKPVLGLKKNEFKKIISTNLVSVFVTCKIIGSYMVSQRKGKIINIGSITSVIGNHGSSAYASSKGGIVQLTKVLAVEWAPYNVNVNCILPGYFLTNLNRDRFSKKDIYEKIVSRTPMNRLGDLSDLIGAAIFLSSSASDFITGISLPVDGGVLAFGLKYDF